MLCGKKHISWDVLAFLALVLGLIGWERIGHPSLIAAPSSVIPLRSVRNIAVGRNQRLRPDPHRVKSLNRAYGANNTTEDGHRLLEALLMVRQCRVTDPRDKVFAVLGIAASLIADTKGSWITYKPNYHDPSRVVFTQAAHTVLEHSRSLALLSFVEDQHFRNNEDIRDLPSWVPNFAVESSNGLADRGVHPVYDCSDVANNVPEFALGNDKFLNTHGALCDVVAEVAAPVDDLLTLEGDYFNAINVICRLSDPYCNGQGRLEVLWRTLVADSDSKVYPLPSSFEKHFQDYLSFFSFLHLKKQGIIRKDGGCQPDFSATNHPYNDLVKANFGMPKLEELISLGNHLAEACEHSGDRWKTIWGPAEVFFQVLDKVGYCRRLFRTQRNLLGLGPMSTCAGDSVYILKGARVPFVLRSITGSGNQQLIGECYVHGVMEGEMLKAEGFKWSEVVIQ